MEQPYSMVLVITLIRKVSMKPMNFPHRKNARRQKAIENFQMNIQKRAREAKELEADIERRKNKGRSVQSQEKTLEAVLKAKQRLEEHSLLTSIAMKRVGKLYV